MKIESDSNNWIPRSFPHGFRNTRILITVIIITVLGVVIWQAKDLIHPVRHRTLIIYCFTGMEEVMKNAIFPAFKDNWQEQTGESVEFIPTFAGSGDITKRIISLLPVEIAIFSSELDAIGLSTRGISFLKQGSDLPYSGILNRTPIVILTREDNSVEIRDFEDLATAGIEIAYPDPTTSGAGKLGLIAIYGARIRAGGTEIEAIDELRAMWRNVVDKPSSAVVDLVHFRQGIGDAMVTYESNLLPNPRRPQINGRIIYPERTVLCEPTVRAIKKNVTSSQEDLVEAFVAFLWSETAQTAFVQFGAHSVIESLNQERADFSSLKQAFAIDEIGNPYELNQIAGSIFEE